MHIHTDEHGIMRCMEVCHKHSYLQQQSTQSCWTTVTISHPSLLEKAIGDVVIVHDEDKPKGQKRTAMVEALVTGSDGHVRRAVVRVRKTH